MLTAIMPIATPWDTPMNQLLKSGVSSDSISWMEMLSCFCIAFTSLRCGLKDWAYSSGDADGDPDQCEANGDAVDAFAPVVRDVDVFQFLDGEVKSPGGKSAALVLTPSPFPLVAHPLGLARFVVPALPWRGRTGPARHQGPGASAAPPPPSRERGACVS